MKFLVQLFLLSVLCIGLSSCEDDQDVVDSTIIGRSWTGDVGMLDDFGMSVISTFSFGADGFGEEVQRYRNGEYCDSFRFQWWWEDSYSRNLVLDYGRYGGISYLIWMMSESVVISYGVHSSFRMILRVLISHYIWNKKIGLFVCSLYSLYREHFL